MADIDIAFSRFLLHEGIKTLKQHNLYSA